MSLGSTSEGWRLLEKFGGELCVSLDSSLEEETFNGEIEDNADVSGESIGTSEADCRGSSLETNFPRNRLSLKLLLRAALPLLPDSSLCCNVMVRLSLKFCLENHKTLYQSICTFLKDFRFEFLFLVKIR